MKRILTTALLIFIGITTYAQKKHVVFTKDMLSSLHLNSLKDTVYIQNRHRLAKFTNLTCHDTIAEYNYTTNANEKISIEIKTKTFVKSNHIIHYPDSVKDKYGRLDSTIGKLLVDGRDGYSLWIIGLPRMETQQIVVNWNNKTISVPDSVYKDLYDLCLCHRCKPAEAYYSANRGLVYLYILGSDGAGAYGVKFVFNKNRYVTRIISTIECGDSFDDIDALPIDCK